MLYKFSDYNNEQFYKDNRVIFVCGSHPIFNSIVIDKVRDNCRGDLDFDESTLGGLLAEFSDNISENSNQQSLTFDDFMNYVRTPSIVGKWFCSLDYKMLTSKQLERLWNYIKKPSENGVIVIDVLDYKNINYVRKNGIIQRSKFVGLINMQYPGRDDLRAITMKMFNDRKLSIPSDCVEYFLMRMSSYYDDYATVIDKIQVDIGDKTTITMDDMVNSLKDIENYMFDDFIVAVVKSTGYVRIQANRKIYKMLKSLMMSMELRSIVARLRRTIDECIEYRKAITNGSIPVLVAYSVKEAKDNLGEKHPLYNVTPYKFKKMAKLASITSLKDWMFMQQIIRCNVPKVASDIHYLRTILLLIHRHSIPNDRLMNAIGAKNTLEEGLYYLNMIQYPDMVVQSFWDLADDPEIAKDAEKIGNIKKPKTRVSGKPTAPRKKKEAPSEELKKLASTAFDDEDEVEVITLVGDGTDDSDEIENDADAIRAMLGINS